MKKLIIFCMTILSVLSMSAQTEYCYKQSKFTDNWFIGFGGGESWYTVNRNDAFFENLSPEMYLKFGKYATPVIGAQLNVTAGANRGYNTFVDYTNVGIDGLLNLTNLFCGYKGRPRTFEVVSFAGAGWYHTYGMVSNSTSLRAGFEFNFNLGSRKAWQLNITPSYNYYQNKPSDNSSLTLSLGFTYRFKNHDGSHYIKLFRGLGETNCDEINKKVNELYEENERIKKELNEKPDTVFVTYKDTVTNEVECKYNVITNAVGFEIGKDEISSTQYVNLSNIADLINTMDGKVIIKGYADKETGTPERNMEISQMRADRVKEILVNKFGVDSEKVISLGMGDTEQPYSVPELNRTVIFVVE